MFLSQIAVFAILAAQAVVGGPISRLIVRAETAQHSVSLNAAGSMPTADIPAHQFKDVKGDPFGSAPTPSANPSTTAEEQPSSSTGGEATQSQSADTDTLPCIFGGPCKDSSSTAQASSASLAPSDKVKTDASGPVTVTVTVSASASEAASTSKAATESQDPNVVSSAVASAAQSDVLELPARSSAPSSDSGSQSSSVASAPATTSEETAEATSTSAAQPTSTQTPETDNSEKGGATRALEINKTFLTLTPESKCDESKPLEQKACIEGDFYVCNGGKYNLILSCKEPLKCFGLPVVGRSDVVSVACTTYPDAASQFGIAEEDLRGLLAGGAVPVPSSTPEESASSSAAPEPTSAASSSAPEPTSEKAAAPTTAPATTSAPASTTTDVSSSAPVVSSTPTEPSLSATVSSAPAASSSEAAVVPVPGSPNSSGGVYPTPGVVPTPGFPVDGEPSSAPAQPSVSVIQSTKYQTAFVTATTFITRETAAASSGAPMATGIDS